MRQFTITLDAIAQRPITYLHNWYGIYAMIDTGSLFPIWVGNERILCEIGAESLSQKVEFGGFGGKAEGKLYKIPLFQFGDLLFPGFHIILHQMELPCQMILPATMFNKLRYEVDDENHFFNVTIPDGQSHVRNLAIKDKDGKLHVLCTSADDENNSMHHLVVGLKGAQVITWGWNLLLFTPPLRAPFRWATGCSRKGA